VPAPEPFTLISVSPDPLCVMRWRSSLRLSSTSASTPSSIVMNSSCVPESRTRTFETPENVWVKPRLDTEIISLPSVPPTCLIVQLSSASVP
jgi:hypothetical protein